MTSFWSKVYGLLGKTPYIYPRYQVWGVTNFDFDFAHLASPPNGSLGEKLLQTMPGNTLSLFWSSMEVTSVSCGDCEKDFRHEGFLQIHINAYHDKRSFTCEQCQEIIVGNKSYLNHKRSHQGKSEKKVIQRKSTSLLLLRPPILLEFDSNLFNVIPGIRSCTTPPLAPSPNPPWVW